MYAAWVLLAMVAGVFAAGKPNLIKPVNVYSKHGAADPVTAFHQQSPRFQEPDKCCTPSNYTYKLYGVVVETQDGKLFTITFQGDAAYDEPNQRESMTFVGAFSNGTQFDVKVITDYKEGKMYEISEDKEGTVTCTTQDTQGPFQKACVPDGSIFTSYVTIGDRILKLAVWYNIVKGTAESKGDLHSIFTVKEGECLFNSITTRLVNSETGAEIANENLSFSDINRGISDPDKWFKPPPECQASQMTGKATQQIRKIMPF